MIDIHCHLLPGVDDGSKSWEMTRAMLRIAAEDGVTHIVCTPHANDTYTYDRPALMALCAQAQEMAGEWPQLLLGCDFHMSVDNILDAIAHPRRYTVGSTPYLLVEFSDFGVPKAVLESVHRLVAAGMRPIITHPERNATLSRAPETVARLIELGCYVQVTASAFTGRFGESVKTVAEQFLKQKLIHFLASDAHNTESRAPRISAGRDAVAKLAGNEIAHALCEENPRAVVEGQPLPWLPTPQPVRARV